MSISSILRRAFVHQPTRKRSRRLSLERLEARSLLAYVGGFAFGAGGAGGTATPNAVASDQNGDTIVAGILGGTVNFNPRGGAVNLTSAGGNGGFPDIFVAKYDPSGLLLWAHNYGNGATNRGNAVAVDPTGNVYVTGMYTATVNFGTQAAPHNLSSPGFFSVYVLKLDSAGNFVYATSSTGGPGAANSLNQALAIAVDPAGDAVIGGRFEKVQLFGATTLTAGGFEDVFVAKLSPAGTFSWAKSFSGTTGDLSRVLGVALDPAGNVYSTGFFQGTVNFNPGPGTFNLTSTNDNSVPPAATDDIFLSKLDTNGNFVFAKRIGGQGFDEGGALAIDPAHNALYLTGHYSGTVNFNTAGGTTNLTAPGVTLGVFVERFDTTTNGNSVWVRDMGINSPLNANGGAGALAVDPAGNLWVTELFDGTASVGPYNYVSNGSDDILLNRLSSAGSIMLSRRAGSAGSDYSNGVTVSPTGAVTVVGAYSGAMSSLGNVPLPSPGAGVTSFYLDRLLPRNSPADYNGDGTTDTAIFDQTASHFYVLESGGGAINIPFGNPAHVNVPVYGDYDGDGKTDVGLYDQTSATFYILLSGGGAIVMPFGNPGHVNVPLSGDYNGDGKTDVGIFDQTSDTFYILLSGGGAIVQALGNPADRNIPLAGDYDGDGKTDVGIFDQSESRFIILFSGGGAEVPFFGNPGHVNVPISGDFDGDGKTDIGIYDQTSSTFLVLASGGGAINQPFGNPSHANIPLAGDYDGDGRNDLAIYDQTSSQFFELFSGGGAATPAFGDPSHLNVAIPGAYLARGLSRSVDLPLSGAARAALDFGGNAQSLAFGSPTAPSSSAPGASAKVTLTAAPVARPRVVNQAAPKPFEITL
jgi:hypothetical protein